MALECVDIWFQDEARFGQQNTTTKLWARKGTRPRASKQQQFEYGHIFGSVCPSRGIGEAIVVPYLGKDVMQQHLAQISAITEPERHAVIIMDGAGWHTDDIAEPFHNVSIIKLPPYSPELNSIEQVWTWMRQHHLANIAFKNYDDIVDRVCAAWNSFLSCSKRVARTCMRDWVNLTS